MSDHETHTNGGTLALQSLVGKRCILTRIPADNSEDPSCANCAKHQQNGEGENGQDQVMEGRCCAVPGRLLAHICVSSDLPCQCQAPARAIQI
jgi:hypothetical protein